MSDPGKTFGFGLGKLGVGEHGEVRRINSKAVAKSPGEAFAVARVHGVVQHQV